MHRERKGLPRTSIYLTFCTQLPAGSPHKCASKQSFAWSGALRACATRERFPSRIRRNIAPSAFEQRWSRQDDRENRRNNSYEANALPASCLAPPRLAWPAVPTAPRYGEPAQVEMELHVPTMRVSPAGRTESSGEDAAMPLSVIHYGAVRLARWRR